LYFAIDEEIFEFYKEKLLNKHEYERYLNIARIYKCSNYRSLDKDLFLAYPTVLKIVKDLATKRSNYVHMEHWNSSDRLYNVRSSKISYEFYDSTDHLTKLKFDLLKLEKNKI
jgi:hypothetical protein